MGLRHWTAKGTLYIESLGQGLKQGDNFHLVSEQEILGQHRKLHHSFHEKNSRKKSFVKGSGCEETSSVLFSSPSFFPSTPMRTF